MSYAVSGVHGGCAETPSRVFNWFFFFVVQRRTALSPEQSTRCLTLGEGRSFSGLVIEVGLYVPFLYLRDCAEAYRKVTP